MWPGLALSLLVHIGVAALLLSFTFAKVEGDGPTIAVELLAEEEPPPPAEEPPMPPKPKPKSKPLPAPPVSNPPPSTTASLALPELPPPPPAVGEAAAHAPAIVATISLPAPTVESVRQSYALALWRHVQLFKPLKLRAEGTAEVSFGIQADGSLISCEISSSSGNARLDEAALESLRRAQPFPPRPPGLGTQPLSFAIPFQFKARSP
ncbi:MAG: TonB family protein [Rhodospirillales bacterium]|nr:TonB family protein [Rhodospirillales bacterium]